MSANWPKSCSEGEKNSFFEEWLFEYHLKKKPKKPKTRSKIYASSPLPLSLPS